MWFRPTGEDCGAGVSLIPDEVMAANIGPCQFPSSPAEYYLSRSLIQLAIPRTRPLKSTTGSVLI